MCYSPSIIKVVKEKGDNTRDDIVVLADIAEKALREI